MTTRDDEMTGALEQAKLMATFMAVGAASLLASTGCQRPPSASPEAIVDAHPSVASPELPAACHPKLRFADYAWVPDDARLTTSIQRDDPELAATLATLARMTEADDVTLPVFAALDFRNLPLQLGNLDRVLDELGHDPDELIELHSPAGELVWLWPSDCPPASVAARVLDRWQIMMRADLEHPGLRWGEGAAAGFPFDVITIGEQRVALTHVGRGAAVGAWLREAEHGGEQGPGRALAKLELAPVRFVLGGASSLLSTHAGAAGQERGRVTASGWDSGEPKAGSQLAPEPLP